MKTIKLNSNNYFDIEQIIKKIAKDNGLDSISEVTVNLNKRSAMVKFKFAEEEELKDGSKYTIYYKDLIEMNGRGIEYITDQYGEEYSPDTGLQGLVEDLGETIPEFHDYELHLYVNADMAGYDLAVDYDPSKTPDDVVDKVNDWLWKNVSFEKIGGEE